MRNKLVKNCNGYKVVRENDNGTKTIVAKIEKCNKGYIKSIYNESKKEWFTPKYFSWFRTLKDVKRFYEI